MQKIEGWDLIQESGELKRLPAGAYACKIIEVIDKPENQYHEVYFDIVEGEYKGYFATLQANSGKNYGKMIRSYKPNALSFFKSYITAIEKSNPGYQWNWDEKSLSGKFCAISFREEEYLKDGEVKVNVKPDEIRSLQALRAGEIKIKPLKKLESPVMEDTLPDVSLSDESLPF